MTFHVPGDTWPVPNPDVTPALVEEAFAEPAPTDATTVGPDLVEVVARVLAEERLYGDPFDGPIDERWHRFRADAEDVLAALAEHGALMPTGGETREERAWWNAELGQIQNWWSYHDSGYKAPDRVRTVTTWPEGHPLAGTHYGLWRPIDG